MIQRIQTVWLLVAGLLSLATFGLPFYTVDLKTGSSIPLATNTTPNILVYMAVILLIVICLVTIALFKKRPLQSRLCLLGMVVSIGLLLLEDHQVDVAEAMATYAGGKWSPGIALPILIIVALIMAMRGIRKDQKLVKSLNRMR